MARIISITYTPHWADVTAVSVSWHQSPHAKPLYGLPQLLWRDGSPWREANQWLMDRAAYVEMRTVQANASALLGYASWLESSQVDWRSFPARKSERCLVRYRGALVSARREGRLASSTVSQRMRQVIIFYRWVKENELFKPDRPMWKDVLGQHAIEDSNGFYRTILVQTTDLKIPNRRAIGDHLEDGLTPVSSTHRAAILRFVKEHGSEELFEMLALGFYTGMRIGTICDLKVETLLNAVPDPNSPGLYWLALGPGAIPPVATKFGVTGQVWISEVQLRHLQRYASSRRRMMREVLAGTQNKNLLFLTRYGNAYSPASSEKSGAINVQLCALRKIVPRGEVIRGFHFHQSRCTFASELARTAMEFVDPGSAVAIVMQALLHRDESTAMKYIKLIVLSCTEN